MLILFIPQENGSAKAKTILAIASMYMYMGEWAFEMLWEELHTLERGRS